MEEGWKEGWQRVGIVLAEDWKSVGRGLDEGWKDGWKRVGIGLEDGWWVKKRRS